MTLAAFQQLPHLAQLYTTLRFGLCLEVKATPDGQVKLYRVAGYTGFYVELAFNELTSYCTVLRCSASHALLAGYAPKPAAAHPAASARPTPED